MSPYRPRHPCSTSTSPRRPPRTARSRRRSRARPPGRAASGPCDASRRRCWRWWWSAGPEFCSTTSSPYGRDRPAMQWRRATAQHLASWQTDNVWVLVVAAVAVVLGICLIVLAATPGLRWLLPMRRDVPSVRAGIDREAAAMVLRDRAMEVSGVQSVRVRMGRSKVSVRARSHFRELDDVRGDLDDDARRGHRRTGPREAAVAACARRPAAEEGVRHDAPGRQPRTARPRRTGAGVPGRWGARGGHGSPGALLVALGRTRRRAAEHADRQRWRDEGWWWPVVIAVLAVLVVLALCGGFIAQLRRARLAEVLVDSGDGEGALLRGRALEGVLESEAESLDGVARAHITLTGSRSGPGGPGAPAARAPCVAVRDADASGVRGGGACAGLGGTGGSAGGGAPAGGQAHGPPGGMRSGART